MNATNKKQLTSKQQHIINAIDGVNKLNAVLAAARQDGHPVSVMVNSIGEVELK